MQDAWEGSIAIRSMWGSSRAASESVLGTMRSGEYDSDYQDLSYYKESDCGSVEGTARGHDDWPLEQHVEENEPEEPEVSREGSDYGAVERNVPGHDDLPPENYIEEYVPEEPELPDEEKPEYGLCRSSRSPVNPLASLLQAKWSPIRFGNRLPAAGEEEGEAIFSRLPISTEEEATGGTEDEDEEEGDGSLTTFQRKLSRILLGLPAFKIISVVNTVSLSPREIETSDPPRIPSPPWRSSAVLEDPRPTTTEPEPVIPPRKKRRMC